VLLCTGYWLLSAPAGQRRSRYPPGPTPEWTGLVAELEEVTAPTHLL
jgi:hypothetical protein